MFKLVILGYHKKQPFQLQTQDNLQSKVSIVKMKSHQINFARLLILCFLLTFTNCLFSKYYRKCRLFKHNKGKEFSQLMQERVATYPVDFYIEPLIQTRKPLEYRLMDYFYLEYIGAGGSGEVYLVEDLSESKPKVFKRFFKEKLDQFEEENFIMHRLNYSIQWTKDDLNGIPAKTDYEKDVNDHKFTPTIAIYPSKESLTLRDVQFFPHEASIIFYKILLEVDKTHKSSIIHNDFKMGNIMINSLGMNFKIFETQLIDWNMASFYYPGFEINTRKGTVCYYSPQQIMRAGHLTPAIDIWALGIVMWTFFTEDKPFFTDCKQNNLKAIASLVGIKKLMQMHQKYHLPYLDDYYNLLIDHIKNPKKYQARSIRDAIPQERQDFFTDDLIDIFERMLTPDPQKRITVTQLLNHKYFHQIKKIPPMFRQKRRAEERKKRNKQAAQAK